MRKYAIELYESMQGDIEICKRKQLDAEVEIECCHQICAKYWQQLQQRLSGYNFTQTADEIEFFKNVKPLFIAEMTYYGLLLHAYLFRPFCDTGELHRFWTRESQRLERFIENNPDFYRYYTARNTNLDECYFTRAGTAHNSGTEENLAEVCRLTATTHDHLVAEILALNKYKSYVQTEMEKIVNGHPGK